MWLLINDHQEDLEQKSASFMSTKISKGPSAATMQSLLQKIVDISEMAGFYLASTKHKETFVFHVHRDVVLTVV